MEWKKWQEMPLKYSSNIELPAHCTKVQLLSKCTESHSTTVLYWPIDSLTSWTHAALSHFWTFISMNVMYFNDFLLIISTSSLAILKYLALMSMVSSLWLRVKEEHVVNFISSITSPRWGHERNMKWTLNSQTSSHYSWLATVATLTLASRCHINLSDMTVVRDRVTFMLVILKIIYCLLLYYRMCSLTPVSNLKNMYVDIDMSATGYLQQQIGQPTRVLYWTSLFRTQINQWPLLTIVDGHRT